VTEYGVGAGVLEDGLRKLSLKDDNLRDRRWLDARVDAARPATMGSHTYQSTYILIPLGQKRDISFDLLFALMSFEIILAVCGACPTQLT
jgi:hypothetical protein